jgi:hypothetical protein
MNDDELHSLIRQSHPRLELPASFNREVWASIAIAEQQFWPVQQWRLWWHDLFFWVARPAPAAVMVATMLVAGIWLGNLTSSGADVGAQRNAYIASINPLISTRGGIHE